MKGLIVVVSLFVLLFALVVLASRKEKYAAPRDETTQPPFVEPPTSNVVVSQTDIYKDMAGLDFQIQSGNPILNFIQGDPTSNTIYGDFVANESLSGSAPMYSFDTEETSNVVPDSGMYNPETTSPVIPFIGDSLPPVPKNPDLVPMSPDMASNVSVQ
jgi:hypothetical protein